LNAQRARPRAQARRSLSRQERLGQRNRGWFLAIILGVIFSVLFNYKMLNMAA
jgi:hypothetical protein